MKKELNPDVIIEVYSLQNKLLASNPLLENIIKKIQTDFPFTFITLKRLNILSNQLEEPFWLIDNNGTILIINEIFAGLFGKKESQLEGKNYIDFIPSSITKLFLMMENCVKDTHECYSIRGGRLKVLNFQPDRQFIEYPILDLKNDLLAIAGFSITKNFSRIA